MGNILKVEGKCDSEFLTYGVLTKDTLQRFSKVYKKQGFVRKKEPNEISTQVKRKEKATEM